MLESLPRAEELEPHPIALMFPEGSPDENRELARNIKATGLRHDIWLYEDSVNGGAKKLYILDGRRRNDACIVEQVEPRYQVYTGDDPLGFAMSLNFYRRHLSVVDRKRIAAEMLRTNPQQTDRAVARKTGISPTTASKVRADIEAAPNVQNGHKDASGPGSSPDAVATAVDAAGPALPMADGPVVTANDAPPAAPSPARRPRVEAGGRRARGRQPAAAKPAREAKPKPIVNERDAWVGQTAKQFVKDANATIEAIGMMVRDLPAKRGLTLKFLNTVGYALVESGDGLSP